MNFTRRSAFLFAWIFLPMLVLEGCRTDELSPDMDIEWAPDVFDRVWSLIEIDASPVELGDADTAVNLSFGPVEKVVFGFSGCNRYSGSYKFTAETLSIGPIAATRMMCTNSMELEHSFLSALDNVTSARLDGGTLVLSNDAGSTTLRFTAAE